MISKMIWLLCSKLPSAVLLRRGRKMQEGDFGDETSPDFVPGSVPGQRAAMPSPARAGATQPGPIPAGCCHGLPLKWSSDHSQQAASTQPEPCWGREGFTGVRVQAFRASCPYCQRLSRACLIY